MTAGRPSGYKPEYCNIAYQLCRQYGADNDKLCEILNITEPTLIKWKYDNREFFKAIQNGKDEYDSEHVEKALLKRAKGFKTQVNGTEKYFPPDPAANIFYLKNRRSNRWRDKIDHQVEGSMNITIVDRFDSQGKDDQE